MVENNRDIILWDFKIQTGKQLLVNEPDTVVFEKEQKRAVVIDVSIPSDSNISKKQHEITEKYQQLKEQLEQIWMFFKNAW